MTHIPTDRSIGFAIPADMARPIMDSLSKEGKVTRGWLGISIRDLNKALAEGLGIAVYKGVLITEVARDSPAARAGLERGDVVVALDGEEVDSSARLRSRLAMLGPGSKVRFRLMREGRELSLLALLDEFKRPSESLDVRRKKR